MSKETLAEQQRNNLTPLLANIAKYGGYAVVYDVTLKAWRRLHGIDAKEQYKAGTVTLVDPDGTKPSPDLTTEA